MKKKILLASLCALALSAAVVLAGCGSSGSTGSADSSASSQSADSGQSTTIRVGAVPTPHAEILTDVVKPILADQGYDLEVVEFNDYILPNQSLASHDIDANYFQHVPYLENYNEENGTDLVAVTTVHFEPFGIYAGKCDSLEELKQRIDSGEQVTIAVPNDTTNEARALLLLADNGIITLPEDADLNVTAIDIVDKKDNVEIKELEAAQVARSLQDVDVACINGNYAQEAGLNVDDALAVEEVESLAAQTYANVLAVNRADQNSEAIKALAAALNSDEVRQYIEDTYGNAVVAVF